MLLLLHSAQSAFSSWFWGLWNICVTLTTPPCYTDSLRNLLLAALLLTFTLSSELSIHLNIHHRCEQHQSLHGAWLSTSKPPHHAAPPPTPFVSSAPAESFLHCACHPPSQTIFLQAVQSMPSERRTAGLTLSVSILSPDGRLILV